MCWVDKVTTTCFSVAFHLKTTHGRIFSRGHSWPAVPPYFLSGPLKETFTTTGEVSDVRCSYFSEIFLAQYKIMCVF